ncbi:TetR/AcrR family transcriptional regulator [soil metagenome]
MTTSARYHHGNLREALVDAAVDAAREHGPDGLAVRELARRVGVSHNAAYRHFADREALVEEVAARGLVALITAMERRLATVPDGSDPVLRARRRLSETGRGYVDFAIAEPGLFKVLFTAYPELPGREGGGPKDHDPYDLLNAALDDLVTVGFLAAAVRPGADVTCWSMVHGFAVLHVEGPLRGTPTADREAALAISLVAIDRGYGATTADDWPPLVLG